MKCLCRRGRGRHFQTENVDTTNEKTTGTFSVTTLIGAAMIADGGARDLNWRPRSRNDC